MALDEVWSDIYSNWEDILLCLSVKFDLDSYQMFDSQGNMVESRRPMVESIICDKADKCKTLFFYLNSVGCGKTENHDGNISITDTVDGRVISISILSLMPITIGGSQNVS